MRRGGAIGMTGGGTLRTGKSSNDTGMSGTGGISSIGKATAANSASDGELSIYLSKTHDSSKMMSLDTRCGPYVPLSCTIISTYVGSSRVVKARNLHLCARRAGSKLLRSFSGMNK